jgi:hypothetical protein
VWVLKITQPWSIKGIRQEVNIYLAMSQSEVYSPFLFAENAVNGINYLDMLLNWLMLQLTGYDNMFIFQQESLFIFTGVFANSRMPH